MIKILKFEIIMNIQTFDSIEVEGPKVN